MEKLLAELETELSTVKKERIRNAEELKKNPTKEKRKELFDEQKEIDADIKEIESEIEILKERMKVPALNVEGEVKETEISESVSKRIKSAINFIGIDSSNDTGAQMDTNDVQNAVEEIELIIKDEVAKKGISLDEFKSVVRFIESEKLATNLTDEDMNKEYEIYKSKNK